MARKKKHNIESDLSTDIFNLFTFLALGPVDLATKLPFYPISLIIAIFIAVFWSTPMFFAGAIIATTISGISAINKLITSLINGD